MHLLYQIVSGVFFIAGLGAIIWMTVRALRNSENPAKIIAKWAFTIPFAFFCIWLASRMGPFGPFVVVFMGIVFSVMWTPQIAEIISRPITNLFDGGTEPPVPRPFYSIALARRKRGEFQEAIAVVREQLAKFPKDYEGAMLLAAIQAENVNDLAAAEVTVNRFAAMPDAPPRQVAAALTQLADWHLKLAQDSYSARMALQQVIDRYPNSDVATAAAQRIAHLGGAEKVLLSAYDRQAVPVPEGIKSAGLRDTLQQLVPAETDPAKVIDDLVRHLAQHPVDTEAREKLAILYAQHSQRLDLAAKEIQQLIDLPGQSSKKVAYWLNLFADLQVRGGADFDTVRATLEQIIERFPDLPVANLAQSRLAHLRLEIKGHQKGPENKTLGTYEQNIGVKYGPTYGSSSRL